MAFWQFKKEKEEIKVEIESPLHSKFSTPFGTVGGADLALPYVRAYGSETYVRFGSDNLYPQLINQMYHTSALNSSIIQYKSNAVIGGSFTLKSGDMSAMQKVREYSFIERVELEKMMRQITKDLILHGRITLLVDPTSKEVNIYRVGPERVRNNEFKTIYSVSSDWSRNFDIVQYPKYHPSLKCKSIYVYEIDGDAGDDIYPIPGYCTSLNDAFLQGQMAYLQKNNIINSIYPSFVVKLAKKFGSEEEKMQFQKTVDSLKGAPAAGRVVAFVGQTLEQLPTIESIDAKNNDKIFDSTITRVATDICTAHQIDPLLMGIRVSGALGNGNELAQQYVIFEKNVVMPLRKMVTEVGNKILQIGNINSTIEINNYQIIDEQIINMTNNTQKQLL